MKNIQFFFILSLVVPFVSMSALAHDEFGSLSRDQKIAHCARWNITPEKYVKYLQNETEYTQLGIEPNKKFADLSKQGTNTVAED